tara:strand:- start:259 stop:438 length:180 start_codon:yes stop_codon:yes gene_type:complete
VAEKLFLGMEMALMGGFAKALIMLAIKLEMNFILSHQVTEIIKLIGVKLILLRSAEMII